MKQMKQHYDICLPNLLHQTEIILLYATIFYKTALNLQENWQLYNYDNLQHQTSENCYLSTKNIWLKLLLHHERIKNIHDIFFYVLPHQNCVIKKQKKTEPLSLIKGGW